MKCSCVEEKVVQGKYMEEKHCVVVLMGVGEVVVVV